ncbi:CDP-alcohol phosphatidyltransferase family protein [Georgenia wangjunii]|uniref:CDP-alcohol phosphatidyltransferase family protein n=1 Tax=Georgenia wangjunii TaxID=3117730 RepID=UPI002F262806
MSTRGQETEQARAERIVTVPNVISLLRLLLVPVFAWLILNEYDVAALVVLAAAGASDWLDGYLARRLNQTTRVGQILDPAADRLYIFVTLIALAWRELVPGWLVGLIVVRELVLAGMIPVLSRYGYGPLPVHMAGKAGTFGLMYAFPLLLLAGTPGLLGVVASTFGWASALWGVGLYWFACLLYVEQVVAIVRTERARARTPGVRSA